MGEADTGIADLVTDTTDITDTTDTTIHTFLTTTLLPSPLPARWDAILIIEGEMTGDNRWFDVDSLTHRELPLPLMLQTETAEGHIGAEIAGSIDKIQKVGAEWHGSGTFDLEGESGREAARMVRDKLLRWVSADVDMVRGEIELAGDNCDQSTGEGCDIIRRYRQGRIMGVTILPFPAFASAVIVPEGVDIPEATANGRIAASALEIPTVPILPTSLLAHAYWSDENSDPPLSHFSQPDLCCPTPITISDDGRVYGHAAGDTCHIGMAGCTTVRDTSRNFDWYNSRPVRTREGSDVFVGQLTLTGGHAEGYLDAKSAVAHYDDTNSVVADVVAGWDEANDLPWFSGSLRPNITKAQIRTLRAQAVSGDWRNIRGELALVAVLSVPVPGFPILRSAVAGGVPQSLIASGVTPNPQLDIESRIKALESTIETLTAAPEPAPLTADDFLTLIKDLRVTPVPPA